VTPGPAFAPALTAAIAGRLAVEDFVRSCAGWPNSPELIAEALRSGLARQDWDAVDILAVACAAQPDDRFVEPLADILDRQCLEISNTAVVAALVATGSPAAVPALSRALDRTVTPSPHWAPRDDGADELGEFRRGCAAGIAILNAGGPPDVPAGP
jgi:HEAT repeat protein